jgi:hypothetical protein
MIPSVSYGNSSAILGLAAKQSTAGRLANSASAADPAAQAGSGVSTYDFTNMTPANMLTTVNSLIKSGQMSLDESSSLVGMMGLAGASPQSFGLAPNAANQPMDFMSSLRRMLSYDQSMSNASGVVYDNKALSALERLQGTPSGVNLSV